uniref:Uncharacterized protein n=1 Tax=Anopheles farauti TaxID=69004 RepID=A0A182QPN9_9DIPT
MVVAEILRPKMDANIIAGWTLVAGASLGTSSFFTSSFVYTVPDRVPSSRLRLQTIFGATGWTDGLFGRAHLHGNRCQPDERVPFLQHAFPGASERRLAKKRVGVLKRNSAPGARYTTPEGGIFYHFTDAWLLAASPPLPQSHAEMQWERKAQQSYQPLTVALQIARQPASGPGHHIPYILHDLFASIYQRKHDDRAETL